MKLNNKTGVYFLSIEGGSKLSCKIAKFISDLPYRYSNIERSNKYYKSNNSNFNDELYFEFEIGKQIELKTKLDNWLTERYALFQETHKGINEFEIHHLEWPIQKLKTTDLEVKYARFENLIGGDPDKAHYSSGVKVLAVNKKEMKTGGF